MYKVCTKLTVPIQNMSISASRANKLIVIKKPLTENFASEWTRPS